ncbi:TetR/AcrR family transcriptional regulator [Curvivirga aplysinae]|uniref:TetR/AcrR family transcriptional regulator n=1 Tax=Curvivirga aplysinae TaxID=2529852 RepID=UPI0012BC2D10|nr:TetR/AcrR family transcriptional regulator [Curvivirga aplysinae]MTI10370.1 TetR/AcrR family transcriptional regulator [Curvivirga aplysinae]
MAKVECPMMAFGTNALKTLTRSEEKQLQIINAAKKVFLEKGFDIASMDMIAAEAGVSKRTVYSHYQSKENLFASIMNDLCTSKRGDIIDETEMDACDLLPKDKSAEETLTIFGNTFLTYIYDPEVLAMLRIMIGQADKFPEIGESFYNQGPVMTQNMLTAYFEHTNGTGETKFKDTCIAAKSFISSLLGPTHLQCMFGGKSPSEEEISTHVDKVTSLFLSF